MQLLQQRFPARCLCLLLKHITQHNTVITDVGYAVTFKVKIATISIIGISLLAKRINKNNRNNNSFF